jgi:uncharacterized protein (TIGR02145 family)
MKKFINVFAAILFTASVFAQTPEKMSYQAVIRNNSNALVTSTSVGMRVSILQGSPTGTEVYKEIYNPNPQTNANGLVSIEIGGGIPLTGTFATIDWANGPYFIKTETDPVGGTNYTITGVSQLLSVPYALYSANGLVAGTTGQTLRHDGTSWVANSNLYNNGTNVGIGTTAPNASALLDIDASPENNKGLLIPRMTTTERNAIAPGTSENSLLIFNTTTQCFEAWNAPSSTWVAFGCIGCTPTTAAAGPDQNLPCGNTTTTLAGNTPTVGTGTWSVVSGTATITTPSSPTSGVTGLVVPGTATLRWTISNPPCTPSTDDVIITTCFPCGSTLTITHTIGTVCPETKSVNYGTVSTTLGGTGAKCWITQNLGATNQASSATDATDAAAGWYWQFNRKQGYKVGPTPAWTITSISETSDWLAAQDPCTIELGAGWRIPTYTEWYNADNTGAWNNYTDAYNSVLKLHAAGYLYLSNGSLYNRGTYGAYWSSTQSDATHGWNLLFFSNNSDMYNNDKAYGFSLRCLRD